MSWLIIISNLVKIICCSELKGEAQTFPAASCHDEFLPKCDKIINTLECLFYNECIKAIRSVIDNFHMSEFEIKFILIMFGA